MLDPQGKTVQNALEQMGYRGVTGVHIGKYIEIDLAPGADKAAAQQALNDAAHKFCNRSSRMKAGNHHHHPSHRHRHPQGKTVQNALEQMGYKGVAGVNIGKHIENSPRTRRVT